MIHNQTAREALVAALRAGEAHNAIRTARVILQNDNGVRQWSFIRNELDKFPDEKLTLKRLKVALLSSFSSEFLHSPLVTYGFLNGLRVEIYQAGFNQFRQEILDPVSGLYSFAPDVVILAVEGRDWVPEIYNRYLERLQDGFEAEVSQLESE